MKTGKSGEVVLPWFVLMLLLAAALRLYDLGSESLWIDEGNSLRDAQVTTLARQSKPLYYWILSLWMRLTRSEFGLRLLAAIFGVAGVIVLYLLGRQLISRRVGLIAALLMAVSPLHVNHSQEVRMYTLLTLWALASTYLLFLLVRDWTNWRAGGYLITSYLMLLTHPLAVFLLPAQVLYILLHWRDKRKTVLRCMVCLIMVLLLWVPWVPRIMQFGDHFVRSQRWAAEAENLSPAHIPLLWGQFMYGEWNRLSYGDRLLLRYVHYAYALVITATAALVWFAGRRRREIWLAASWALMPLALMILLSEVMDRAWPPRYLIYTSPALFLLLAQAIAGMPRKAAPLIIFAVLSLPALRLFKYYENTLHPEWRKAVRYVDSVSKPSDVVCIYKPSNRFVFSYYHSEGVRWMAVGEPTSDGDLSVFAEHEPGRIADALPRSHRSWLMLSRVDEKLPEELQRELSERGRKVKRRGFYGIDILEVN